MDELISREKALKALEDANVAVKGLRFGKTILAEYSKQVREGYIDVLRDIPSEDAEHIRYGSWRTVGKTEHGTIIRECTACGVQKKGGVKSTYCPDCGAKMRMSDIDVSGQVTFVI